MAKDEGKAKSRDEIDSTENSDKVPVKASQFQSVLKDIQTTLRFLVDKQSQTVSPEFNALMDGYVNKANESETFKAKFGHIESIHEEQRIELKAAKDANKHLVSDLEAAREALRLSESDLVKFKRDWDTYRSQTEEKITLINDEREQLKSKVKDLQEQRDKNLAEITELKAQSLESKHLVKQIEQEKMAEIETTKRSLRESNQIIDELKEQLDLRTREIEYKDALLNQLIRQASVDDEEKASLPNNSVRKPSAEAPYKPEPKTKLEEWQDINESKSNYQGSRWGAFRK